MEQTADAIIKRLGGFPGAKDAGGKPLCCVSTIGKNLDFDVDGNSNKADIIATMNTDDIDGDREVILANGLDPDYFKKNGKVFVDHVYSHSHCVGFLRALKLVQRDDGKMMWRARVGIHSTDLGRDTMIIAQESGQIGFSIGFFPEDYGDPTTDELAMYSQDGLAPVRIVRRANWFETSVTPFPCNVNCQGELVMAADVADQSKAMLENLLTRGLIKRDTAIGYGLETAERITYATMSSHGKINRSRLA